jgi:chromate transport protein ChrA
MYFLRYKINPRKTIDNKKMQNLSSPNLSQLALSFLKIGVIGFGRLAAHIAYCDRNMGKIP